MFTEVYKNEQNIKTVESYNRTMYGASLRCADVYVYGLFHRIGHRGPDWSGYRTICPEDKNISHGIGHERLAIVDPESGAQPMVNMIF